ncbi:MAG TPA: serine/threonine-protein kinase, partial [Polyangia bacterium]|nr:serine/threonine-protein kinase [Polyangia bacterium]
MRPGDVIGERFEIQRLAGSGGMGAVYRALDRSTGGAVALKILRGGKREDELRLAREARTLADLNHPAVIRYLGQGLTDTGEPFLVTEWLEGEDLGQRLARSVLSMQESVTLARHVADALAAAHARGFVHRDIKPANIFLLGGRVDDVRVLDFGIARSTRATGIVTRTGCLVGTLGYMAPEQARGTHELDARTDIFSLGCILFECLTGRPVFAGEAMLAVIVKILFEEAPRVRDLRADLPAALDDLVARMLCKDPVGRPQDAAQVARELGAILEAAPQVELSATRSPHLTSEEMRPVSVVIATVIPESGAAAPTASESGAQSEPGSGPASGSVSDPLPGRGGTLLFERVSSAVAPLGARLERLPDGSVVATLVAQGSAMEQAMRAARTALAMRAALPEAALVLATGRGS